MKHYFFRVLILSIATFSLVACSSDDDGDPLNENLKREIENSLKNNTWIITKYIDSGEDELYHYNGYEFMFADSGVLTATNGINTYTGTWSITNSSSSSSSSNDVDFNIFFASPEDFEELSDDWDILSNTSTKIELIDISGGNGGTDYLTFERN